MSRNMTSSTWVKRSTPVRSFSGDDADRALALDDDGGAVRALAEQDERLAGRHVRVERDRGVVDEVALLDPADDLADDLDRDVLRDDGEAAASGHRLGHPAPGDGGHVGDDDRDGRPGAVDRREVDVEAARHRRAARHHEHVVVGEVVLRLEPVEEVHSTTLCRMPLSSLLVTRQSVDALGSLGEAGSDVDDLALAGKPDPTARRAEDDRQPSGRRPVGRVRDLDMNVRLGAVAGVATGAHDVSALTESPGRTETLPLRRCASRTKGPVGASAMTTWFPAIAFGPTRAPAWVSA